MIYHMHVHRAIALQRTDVSHSHSFHSIQHWDQTWMNWNTNSRHGTHCTEDFNGRLRRFTHRCSTLINTSRAEFSTSTWEWDERHRKTQHKKCESKLSGLMCINRFQDAKFRSLIYLFWLFRKRKYSFSVSWHWILITNNPKQIIYWILMNGNFMQDLRNCLFVCWERDKPITLLRVLFSF